MRIGDELVARHEETVARLYPGASTSHLRFQLHQAFYNIFIPTVLPDGLNSRPASTNHEVIDPSLLGVADGSLMSFSASLPPSPLAPWTVLAQGPAPPSSWFTATASGAVRSVDYLSQPSHRMPWHKFQKPEEIRELINVLEAQIKIRVWERKMTAFENETDKGALPRDSTATEASTAKIAEELVQEAEERRAHEIGAWHVFWWLTSLLRSYPAPESCADKLVWPVAALLHAFYSVVPGQVCILLRACIAILTQQVSQRYECTART